MLFDKNMTATQFEEKFPELYAEVFNLGKSNGIAFQVSAIEELKKENSLLKKNEKILSMGKKLNKITFSESLINSEKSMEDCLTELIEAPEDKPAAAGIAAEVFLSTAPPAAGQGETEIDVTDQDQAKAFVAKKYSLTKRSEITQRARRDFPSLFVDLPKIN